MEEMKVAVVEDDSAAAEKLCACLKRYTKERGTRFKVTVFSDAVFFLTDYKPDFDCVFMDIDLPFLNGIEGALRLRKADPYVPVIFVTSLARYAVKGYEAAALDYLVKPYSYEALAMSLTRAERRAEVLAAGSITVRNTEGARRLAFDSLYYVEVHKHRLLYHTDTGVVDVWGSMPDAEAALPAEMFCKCGASWLVNLSFVRAIRGNFVDVAGDMLKISRARKKPFIAAIHAYLGGGGYR